MSKTDTLADEILETLKEYPEADPCEVIDELIRVISIDEELTAKETRALHDAIARRGY